VKLQQVTKASILLREMRGACAEVDDAFARLQELQSEYADWQMEGEYGAPNFYEVRTGLVAKLDAVASLDLSPDAEDLDEIARDVRNARRAQDELPLGWGRDEHA
jgi:hypothetical protein